MRFGRSRLEEPPLLALLDATPYRLGDGLLLARVSLPHQRHRVVVRRHQHEALRMRQARKDRDDIGQIDVPKNLPLPRAFLNGEVLIAYFEARTVTLQRVVDPSLRRADSMHWIVLRRKNVTRSEAFQLLERRRDSGFVD